MGQDALDLVQLLGHVQSKCPEQSDLFKLLSHITQAIYKMQMILSHSTSYIAGDVCVVY